MEAFARQRLIYYWENMDRIDREKFDEYFRLADESAVSSDIGNHFNVWQDSDIAPYEKTILEMSYYGHCAVAEAVSRYFTQDQKTKLRVLDICSGTGLVAIELRKLGLYNIDALDASSEMMSITKERGLYVNYIHAYFSDKQLDIDDASYDAVTVAGGYQCGLVPPEGLHEMIRLVRPGGLIIFADRSDREPVAATLDGRGVLIHSLEEKGTVTRLEHGVFGRWYLDRDGTLSVFRVQK